MENADDVVEIDVVDDLNVQELEDIKEPESPVLQISEDSFNTADLQESPIFEVNWSSIEEAKN